MEHKGSNILEGEASESDEEIADYPSFIQNTMVVDYPTSPAQQKSPSTDERSSGVVISGEASESDEEEHFEYAAPTRSRDFHSPLAGFPDHTQTELEVEPGVAEESSKYRDGYKRPKFKSPFHKRLRENSFYLRCGIVENTLETYENACYKIQSCIPILSRTQSATQDTLQDLRIMIESLASMQLRNDDISNAKMLPCFKE